MNRITIQIFFYALFRTKLISYITIQCFFLYVLIFFLFKNAFYHNYLASPPSIVKTAGKIKECTNIILKMREKSRDNLKTLVFNFLYF